MTYLVFIIFISYFFIAFSVGSNDTSNALSVSIGAGIIQFKKAVFLFGCLVFIGIRLQGHKIIHLVGKRLLTVSPVVLIVVLPIAAFLIILANWQRLPLSTHQVIIGGLTGAGLGLGVKVNFYYLFNIAISWIVSPFGAFCLALLIYRAMEVLIPRLPFFQIERLLKFLLLISSAIIAYNTGANELATVAAGVVSIHQGLSFNQIALTGSFSVFLGALLLSRRVIKTVGKELMALDPYSGFAAQFGAGLCVWLFTSLGIPVSTTYCIIGGIAGVGASKGMTTVRVDLLKKIALSCVLTPVGALIICFTIARLG